MRMLRVGWLAAPALLVVACAASPAAPGQAPPAPGAPYRVLQAQPEAAARPDPVLATWPFLEHAKLSAAQKKRITVLLNQQRPPLTEADFKQQARQWQELLSAPELDTVALRAFLQARDAEAREQHRHALALLGQLRAMLTSSQRKAVAAGIRRDVDAAEQQAQASPPPQPQPESEDAGQGAPALELSAEQQALFEAALPAPDPAIVEAAARALADYMAGGSLQALEAASSPRAEDDARHDALVKAYASLTRQQRKALVSARGPQAGG